MNQRYPQVPLTENGWNTIGNKKESDTGIHSNHIHLLVLMVQKQLWVLLLKSYYQVFPKNLDNMNY